MTFLNTSSQILLIENLILLQILSLLFTLDPGSSAIPSECQLARDSPVLCISLSTQHDCVIVKIYIAEHSNITVLATGLSSVYSSLPRTLGTATDTRSWSQVSPSTGDREPSTIMDRARARARAYQLLSVIDMCDSSEEEDEIVAW